VKKGCENITNVARLKAWVSPFNMKKESALMMKGRNIAEGSVEVMRSIKILQQERERYSKQQKSEFMDNARRYLTGFLLCPLTM